MQSAGLLRRFAAMLYDSLLVTALLFLVTLPFVAARGGEPVEPGENVFYRLSLLAVVYVFFVGYWTTRGRTLGMQSWGLQIETADRSPPSLGQASVRFVVSIASWLALGLGFLWQLWDRDGLSWHDRASGTRLVYYPKSDQTQGASD